MCAIKDLLIILEKGNVIILYLIPLIIKIQENLNSRATGIANSFRVHFTKT